MASWEATGPLGDLLLGALDRRHGDVGLEVLHDAAGDEEERGDERNRQEDPEDRARAVEPEVSDPLGLLPGDAADDRHRDRDAGRRRQEVVQGEPGHLGEVRHRRLARVALPVGVGREGDGRVPGRVGRDRPEAVGVEGQPLLEALHRVEDDERGGVDDQHRDRPFDPALVLLRVDAAETIDARARSAGETDRGTCVLPRRPSPCSAPRIGVRATMIAQVDQDPAMCRSRSRRHTFSARSIARQQVQKQAEPHDEPENVFPTHCSLSSDPVAAAHVDDRQPEQEDRGGQKDQVQHLGLLQKAYPSSISPPLPRESPFLIE